MVLAAGAAVTVVLVRGQQPQRSAAVVPLLSDVSTMPPTRPILPAAPSPTSAAPRTAPSTAAGGPRDSAPPQPLGNLLANGDFERDLGGWGVLGNGQADRVADAHAGGWAVRIRTSHPPPGRPGSTRPGILAANAVQAEQGRSYEASAWVRASRPGTEVALALREYGAVGETGSDVTGVTLPDRDWHEVAVVHQVHQSGTRLGLELTVTNLRPGGDLLADQLSITAP